MTRVELKRAGDWVDTYEDSGGRWHTRSIGSDDREAVSLEFPSRYAQDMKYPHHMVVCILLRTGMLVSGEVLKESSCKRVTWLEQT